MEIKIYCLVLLYIDISLVHVSAVIGTHESQSFCTNIATLTDVLSIT